MISDPVSAQSALTPAQLMRHDALRKQAAVFVAQTFFMPIFKQMRASPFRSELFSGGRGGQAFQSMLDGVLAERMGRGAGNTLVDAIAARLDPQVARALRPTRISGGSMPTLQTNPSTLNLKG